jgi:predicted phosphodiesterase
LGDIVENFCNTSSQRGTNDRALTEQIRIARRLMLQAVLMFSPLTEKLTYLAIPSNHGSVRLASKSPENHVLDDYGIEIAEQIRDVAQHSDKLKNLQVVIPETSMESLSYTTHDGTTLGLVHGHQAGGPNGLSKWWAGQDHGRMPTAGADILLVGHYHSLKVEQSGDARWVFICPASEVGSSWFRNKTGQASRSGILTMTVKSGQWSNLVIQ